MIPTVTRLPAILLSVSYTRARFSSRPREASTVQNRGTNRVFIPALSDRISLSAEWTFRFLVRTDSATLRIASLIRPAASGADSPACVFWLILRPGKASTPFYRFLCPEGHGRREKRLQGRTAVSTRRGVSAANCCRSCRTGQRSTPLQSRFFGVSMASSAQPCPVVATGSSFWLRFVVALWTALSFCFPVSNKPVS